MSCGWDIVGEAGLQFFGKMTASISHEIKNTLAIINENAGLLEDFALMADKGKPVNPERLQTLAGAVKTQIRRADDIVRNMNRFAHSVDESLKGIDLADSLQFVVALSGRLAAMRGVTLEQNPPPRPIVITVNPFFLETLVWLCLDFAMDAAGEHRTVQLITEETGKGARIRFTKLEGLTEAAMDRFPAKQHNALLRMLNADLATKPTDGEIVVTFS